MTRAIPYDLTRPPPLKPRDRAALRHAATRAADILAALAAEYLGRPLAVTLSDAACPHGANDTHGGADRWAWVVAHDARQAPVWRMETAVASALVDIMVGCPPQGRAAHDRPLSRLDRRLVALLCEELATGVEAAWPGVVPPGAAWRCLRGSRDLGPPDHHAWTCLAFDLRLDDLRGRLDLFLPLAAALRSAPSSRPTNPSPARLDAPGVRTAPVQATVHLGAWHATLRELVELRPGAIIPLDRSPHTPLELCVAGVAKLPVRPGTSHGRVAVQVTGGPLPPD